ncbi:hypothetical protein NQ315_017286 [Exocentrus adspersus]|uniref:Translation initiation factor eIF2B subunit beta n=1 Tax=Exocentrus adspersus TaxID=1586481 RepID=A0AAV8VJR4_9CUCU|nr:hypothetical protein NQ315_017286 [Exocentrus adspersus]
MLEQDNLSDVIKLVSDIRHKKLFNSYDIALKTEELLEKLISEGYWRSARELMTLVKTRMKYTTENLSQEATALNIMRHILKIIREEYEAASKKKGEGQSLHQLVTANPNSVLDYSESLINLKSRLLDHLTEYKVELESSSYLYLLIVVMVLSNMYKFTPNYVASHDHTAFNICASPANVIPYCCGQLLNKIEVYNPVFDYVPPELVTLFISHQGGNAPSYVYRLLSELYHQDDYDM